QGQVFRIFQDVPFEKISVVILGQDPYHGANQADGRAFSVPQGVRLPPSLRNIFQAMLLDGVAKTIPQSGDLSYLTRQGVFLFNTLLTVEHAKARSHAGWGWEIFTEHV